jgi:DnaJ family protein C protein 7
MGERQDDGALRLRPMPSSPVGCALTHGTSTMKCTGLSSLLHLAAVQLLILLSLSLSLSPHPSALLSQAEELKSEGNTKYAAGEYQEAVDLYTEAIAVCPAAHSAPFYGNRSAAYLMLKNWIKAMEDSQTAIKLDPTFAKGWHRIHKIQIAQGHYDAALQTLTEMTAKTPIKAAKKDIDEIKAAQDQFKQLQQSMENKSYSSVLYQAEKLLDKSPASVPIQVMKCDAMLQLKQFEKAKALSTELYKSEPRNADVLRVRGLAMYYTSNIEMAQKHFSEVLRFDPDNTKCFALFKMIKALEKAKARGNELFAEGKNAEAVQAYTEALELDPLNVGYNAILYSNRSAAYVKLRKFADAVSDCNKCLSAKPDFLKARIRRASCYVELKMFDEAIRDYNDLLKEDQQNPEYRAGLAKAKLELKKSKRKDYYAILGVPQNALSTEIKKAYRKKALEHHPDKAGPGDEARKAAEAKFKDITEAYETLSDQQKKQRYDSGVDLEDDHHGHGHGHGGFSQEDIFSQFFSRGGGGRGGFGFG